MKKVEESKLKDFHKALNERLIKKISGQPSMSREESIEQTRRLARQSTQNMMAT